MQAIVMSLLLAAPLGQSTLPARAVLAQDTLPEAKPAKSCPCSPACECGCNQGLPCRCGEPREVRSAPPAYRRPAPAARSVPAPYYPMPTYSAPAYSAPRFQSFAAPRTFAPARASAGC